MAIAATIAKPAESSILQGKKSVEPILRTENLWKLYRAGKVEVPALRGVNFEVLPGESVAVMGPSGCGKSSLLYLIGGLAQATRRVAQCREIVAVNQDFAARGLRQSADQVQ